MQDYNSQLIETDSNVANLESSHVVAGFSEEVELSASKVQPP